ncbi:THAP domain-containing protein 1-like [Tachypleus tridentatus]|uniref:THAP domain-containing protein 1-like n=1 Tax=Tachypleus tridentatus TaxID=6853 RepID=UPI003FD06067
MSMSANEEPKHTISNRQDRDPRKSFHRFPTDPERRSRWIAAVKREGWQPTSASRVCSDHFILKVRVMTPFP